MEIGISYVFAYLLRYMLKLRKRLELVIFGFQLKLPLTF